METELRTLLTGNAGVAALVSTRVYPVVLPQNTTMPAIVYQELRSDSLVQADGDTGARRGRFMLSCWASSYGGTKSLAAAVLAAVNGVASGSLMRIAADAMRDDYDQETGMYRQIIELEIFWS